FAMGRVGLVVPLVLAWTGSAALVAWGMWSSVVGLIGEDDASRATTLMSLVTTLEIGVGLVILVTGLHLVAQRTEALRAQVATVADATEQQHDRVRAER